MSSPDLTTTLTVLKGAVDLELERWLPPVGEEPIELHEAMRHAVFPGGKRLRPALAMIIGRASGAGDASILSVAAALELVHTYSLVHDDLPCMDDDALRRGRPTCHVVFGEALAVLAGDALLTLAFEVLASCPAEPSVRVELCTILARGCGARGMVGGQVLDLQGEGTAPERGRVEKIHRLKTAALMGAGAAMGAVAGGLAREDVVRYETFGQNLGLAFQIIDDILDLEGATEELGKTAGKDLAQKKMTFPAAVGLEAARAEARCLTETAKGNIDGLPARNTLCAIADRLLCRIS